MTRLERRCRLLLRAYPATYRLERGEEIIGTLLEATAPERSWPLLRDIRGLIFGGLRAHSAQPRQFTTVGNLRIAVLASVAAGLGFSVSVWLAGYVRWLLMSRQPPANFGWPLAANLMPLIPVALTWLSRRRLVVLAGALPAAAAICYVAPWRGFLIGSTVLELGYLAALVALAGYAERPGWGRFWPLGLLAIAPLPLGVVGPFTGVQDLALLQAVGILSIAWMVIDARPAIAMALLLLATQLQITIYSLANRAGFQLHGLVALGVTAITAVAVWRLRRQSARGAPA